MNRVMNQDDVESDGSTEYEYCPPLVPSICSRSLAFQWFTIELMHPLLQSCKPFIVAIRKVEDLIRNDNLVVYFAHVCLSQFRTVNVFNVDQASQYIDAIRTFLIHLLPQLRFSVRILPNDFSIFLRMSNASLEFDEIVFDETMICGMINIPKKDDSEIGFARSVLLLFSKTIHEIAHACVAETGRSLSTTNFDTPPTHTLTGEAGNAMERFLFGSVLDVKGKYSQDRSMYHVSQIVFHEARVPSSVSSISLKRFFKTDISVIKSLHDIVSPVGKKRTTTRKRKKTPMTNMTRLRKEPYKHKKFCTTHVSITTTTIYKSSARKNSTTDKEDDSESDEPYLAPDKFGFLCAYGPILGVKR